MRAQPGVGGAGVRPDARPGVQGAKLDLAAAQPEARGRDVALINTGCFNKCGLFETPSILSWMSFLCSNTAKGVGLGGKFRYMTMPLHSSYSMTCHEPLIPVAFSLPLKTPF